MELSSERLAEFACKAMHTSKKNAIFAAAVQWGTLQSRIEQKTYRPMQETERIELNKIGMTKEEFFGGISIPRNKELMRIYRDVELVESLGSGVPRVLQAYGQECFHFTENFTRIVFPADQEVVKMLEEEDNYQENKEDYQENKQLVGVPVRDRILQILQEDNTLSVADIADRLFDITASGVQYHINQMKKQGCLRRIGPDKGGYWEVIDNKE